MQVVPDIIIPLAIFLVILSVGYLTRWFLFNRLRLISEHTKRKVPDIIINTAKAIIPIIIGLILFISSLAFT